MTQRISHWIDGRKTPGTSGRTSPAYNPAIGEQTGTVDLASAAEVNTAVATAVFTSAAEARSTVPVCSPMAGLYAGEVRPEVPGVLRPSIQCEIRCVMASRYVLPLAHTTYILLRYKHDNRAFSHRGTS